MKTKKHTLYFVLSFHDRFTVFEKEDNVISFFEILLRFSDSREQSFSCFKNGGSITVFQYEKPFLYLLALLSHINTNELRCIRELSNFQQP